MPAYNVKRLTPSRVHHFQNEVIISSVKGLVKRYGHTILDLSLTEEDIRKLVAASNAIQGTLEDNYFWTNEILDEVRQRIQDGRIIWPLPEFDI
jgi:hypothetical protein